MHAIALLFLRKRKKKIDDADVFFFASHQINRIKFNKTMFFSKGKKSICQINCPPPQPTRARGINQAGAG
jgi:hypothetical protein